MIGVQHHEEGSGEIRRLRVAEGFRRRGIGSALVEAAGRKAVVVKCDVSEPQSVTTMAQLFARFAPPRAGSSRGRSAGSSRSPPRPRR